MARALDDYRLLGRSGLRVSPLSLGTLTFGAGEGLGSSDDEAQRILDRYMELGGNFLDTANCYGNYGGSETTLGKVMAGRRQKLVVATKYSLTTRPGDPNASGNHRKSMVRSVEDSLRRMGTDYIDLLYLHVWDYRTPVEEILRAFDDLVRSGKILYAGMSDAPAWQISRMQAIADLRGWSPFVALQIPYNLIERDVERELIPMAREMELGVLPWSPLAGGILSGKYQMSDACEGGLPMTRLPETRKEYNQATGKLSTRNLGVAQAVSRIASEVGATPAQVALAWTMLDPVVVSPLIGARNLAQLDDNLGALAVELEPGHVSQLNSLAPVEMGFPHNLLNSDQIAMQFGGIKAEVR